VTVWDQDAESSFVPYDVVDEFSFDYTLDKQFGETVLTKLGIRDKAKSV